MAGELRKDEKAMLRALAADPALFHARYPHIWLERMEDAGHVKISRPDKHRPSGWTIKVLWKEKADAS